MMIFDSICFIFYLHLQRSEWHGEPYIRGAYSFQNPTSQAAGLGPENLAKPIENRIFFAGEATNPKHYATVHGAMESGYRAAEEIMAL